MGHKYRGDFRSIAHSYFTTSKRSQFPAANGSYTASAGSASVDWLILFLCNGRSSEVIHNFRIRLVDVLIEPSWAEFFLLLRVPDDPRWLGRMKFSFGIFIGHAQKPNKISGPFHFALYRANARWASPTRRSRHVIAFEKAKSHLLCICQTSRSSGEWHQSGSRVLRSRVLRSNSSEHPLSYDLLVRVDACNAACFRKCHPTCNEAATSSIFTVSEE